MDADARADRLPFDGVMAEVVRDAVVATREEARASVVASADSMALTDGRPLGASGADRLWSFDLASAPAVHPETPGMLAVEGRDLVAVRVLAVGDGNVVLGMREELGDAVPLAHLSLTAGAILDALEVRLEHLVLDDEADATLVDALLAPDPDGPVEGLIPLEEEGPDAEQRTAASNAIVDGLRFTWGPPGTGKTRVLGMAVAEAMERGDRVLVVAHANAAVDVAMARVADLVDDEVLGGGHVLRVGTPHLPVIGEHPALLVDHHLAERHPEQVERRRRLGAERAELSSRLRRASEDGRRLLVGELQDLRSEARQLDRELSELGRGAIADAQVVGATLARLVIDDEMWSWPADTVIVDEASMVGLPFALALAARRPRTLSFFGDFRQLPPIAVGASDHVRRWYGRDVFDAAGVIAAWEEGRVDRRIQMLRTQFRMGEQICAVINPFAYGGTLATDPAARDRAVAIAEMWPSVGSEVVVVDTSGLGGDCLTDAAPDSSSRSNAASASLAVTIAEVVAADVSVEVGIISPYRSQVDLLTAATADHPRITAATVHRFQGSERDVVILDLTDGPDQQRPSRLTGGDPDLSMRLLNVAASRARGKLIVLADLAWVDRSAPVGSSIRRLLEIAEDAGADVVDAVDLLASAPAVPDESPLDPVVSWFPSWSQAVQPADDPGWARVRRLDLHVPSAEHGGDWLGELLRSRASEPDLRTVLRAPFAVARDFEDLDVEVRLLTHGRVPWAIGDGIDARVGGRDPEQPAARIIGRRFAAAYGRITSVS